MQRLAAIACAFLLGSVLACVAEDAAVPVAVAARLSQGANGAELSFDLSRPASPRVYALTSPDRLVIDLPRVNFRLDPSMGRVGTGAIVKGFRFGPLGPDEIRALS